MRSILIVLAFSFSFASCSIFKPVTIVPPFEAAIVNDITTVGQKVDGLYSLMEQSLDKSYSIYIPQYVEIEAIINSIEHRNSLRPKNVVSGKQITLYKNLFLKFKSEHLSYLKLNDSQIRTYKNYMADQLKPLFVAEMSLK